MKVDADFEEFFIFSPFASGAICHAFPTPFINEFRLDSVDNNNSINKTKKHYEL